jgi:hypothetical protein
VILSALASNANVEKWRVTVPECTCSWRAMVSSRRLICLLAERQSRSDMYGWLLQGGTAAAFLLICALAALTNMLSRRSFDELPELAFDLKKLPVRSCKPIVVGCKMLLKSCAIPPVSRPIACIFCDCSV